MYLLINFYQGSSVWVNNTGPIAMYESYKSDDISCKNIFGVYKDVAK